MHPLAETLLNEPVIAAVKTDEALTAALASPCSCLLYTSGGAQQFNAAACVFRAGELLAKTLGISPLDVLQDKAGTNVLLCETKQEGEHHD